MEKSGWKQKRNKKYDGGNAAEKVSTDTEKKQITIVKVPEILQLAVQ